MTELARAEVVIGGNDTDLQNTLARASKSMGQAGKKMQRIGTRMSATITAPLVAMGAGAVKAFGDFDQAMTESIAIMGDVSNSMRSDMAAAAREVSKTTTASASEAAEAYFFLASAGLDAQQSVAALPQVAKFAQAGMFDLSTATDLATDAQSALGLASEDAQENLKSMKRVTDTLVGANALANASVEQFSTALTTEAGAAMKTFGIDIEEGVAVLAAFADQGIKGQRAGSGFSRVLRLMSQAAVNNKEEMEALGLSFFDAEGQMRNMSDIIADLTRVLGGMSDEQRAAALESIGFTARVQGIIQPLLGTSAAIREYEGSLRNMAGVTAEVSDKQMESFNNKMTLVKNNLINAAIVIGETVAPKILAIGQAFGRAATGFSEMNPAVRNAGLAVAAFAAAAGPALIVAGSLTRAVSTLTGSFVALGAAQVGAAVAGWASAFASLAVQVRTLSGAFALLQVAMGPAGWIILGVTAAVTAIATLDGVFADLRGGVVSLATKIRDELQRDMKALGIIGSEIGEAFGKLFGALGEVAESLAESLGFIVEPLREIKELLDKIDVAKLLLVMAGPGIHGLVEARKAWVELREAIIEADESAKEASRSIFERFPAPERPIFERFPNFASGSSSAAEEVEKTTSGATDAVQDLIDGLQEEFNELRFTERQLLEYRLSTEGASAADRDHALSLFEKVQALKRLASEMTPLNQLMRAATQATSMFGVAISGLPDSFEGVFDAAFRQAESAFDRFSDLTERMMSTREELTKIKEDARKHVADLQSDIALAKLQDQLRETRQIARDFASSFTDAFMSIIDGSKSLAEAFGDMIQSLIADMARAMIQKALFNVVMGFFGGGIPDAPGPIPEPAAPNFAGKFASGGMIPSGSFGVVGERGPEIVTGPAKVVPMEGGSNREVHIHEGTTNINIAALDPASFRDFAERNADVFAAATAKGSGRNTGLRRAILAGR